MRIFANFPALGATVFARKRPNKEGMNSTDDLAFALSTCLHSVCVARLTLWTLGYGTMMVNYDTHLGRLRLSEVVYNQLLTL